MLFNCSASWRSPECKKKPRTMTGLFFRCHQTARGLLLLVFLVFLVFLDLLCFFSLFGFLSLLLSSAEQYFGKADGDWNDNSTLSLELLNSSSVLPAAPKSKPPPPAQALLPSSMRSRMLSGQPKASQFNRAAIPWRLKLPSPPPFDLR